MTSSKVLSRYFKLFELFGLQYFAFQSFNEKSSQQKRPSKFYTVYFVFLLILFFFLTILYVAIYFDDEIEDLKAKTAFILMMKVIMEFGIIGIMISGLIESYCKTKQLKSVLIQSNEILEFYKTNLGYDINYKSFNDSWKKKAFRWLALFILDFGSLSTFQYFATGHFFHLIFGVLPMFFLCLLIFKIIFHFDLINFQLENLHEALTIKRCFKADEVFRNRNHHCRALELRRCYHLIYEMAQIVNSILSITLLLVLVVFVVVLIISGFHGLFLFINSTVTEKIIRKPFIIAMKSL